MINLTIKEREPAYVQQITDWHIGSNHCNLPWIKYQAKRMREIERLMLLIITGDIFECGSLRVGNSAFKQELSLNQQKRIARKILKPVVNMDNVIPLFATPGNHEARLMQDNDFDFMEDFIETLGDFDYTDYTEAELALNDDGHFVCSPDFVSKVMINNKPLKIYGRHGVGSAKRLDLAMGKIVRETTEVDADILLEGHNHRCHSFPTYIKTSIDEGKMKPRLYSFGGHALRYNKSYAHAKTLPILPEAFNRVNVVDAHGKLHYDTKEFFIHRYRPDLFKI